MRRLGAQLGHHGAGGAERRAGVREEHGAGSEGGARWRTPLRPAAPPPPIMMVSSGSMPCLTVISSIAFTMASVREIDDRKRGVVDREAERSRDLGLDGCRRGVCVELHAAAEEKFRIDIAERHARRR